MKTRKVALYGLFLALALIFGYVEQLIPINIGIPGVKLGLANIITMMVLYYDGWKGAGLISFMRILLAGMLFGNGFAIVYSMAGACASILMMALIKKTGAFGVTGISIIGGISHNLGQIAVAMIVLETKQLVYYTPVLLISGMLAGIAVGIISGLMIKRLEVPYKQSIE